MQQSLPNKLPIDRISLTTFASASVGALLIAEVGSNRRPWLSIRDPHQDENIPFVFDMTPSATRYMAVKAANSTGRFLAIDSWRLIVNPASAYTATTGAPALGDAFISSGEAGLIGKWNGGEAYVGIGGFRLPMPDWSNDCVGFTEWWIVIEDNNGDDYTIFHNDGLGRKPL